MLAPHNVTSTLRMMSDAQLAQYAQMHQNDPYIFPLAFQESQDRKNMRAQQMAKQTGQAQPPVNQQDLAQMMPQRPAPIPQAAQAAPQAAPQALPEEQGIGTLPADNLQKMAGGGITGEHHFDKGGSAYGYTPLSKEDLPTNPTAEEINQYTGALRAGAEAAAAPEQAKTAQLFDPYIQKLQAKQADIEDRKATNTQMALLQAGLGMLGGTSPYAFQNIAAGGKEGVAAYVSGKKAIEDSQDALDHSQFLAEQAKSAALKGDVKDQIALQNAAQSSMMAGKHLQLAGISALNTSQAKAGELAAQKEKNAIDFQKAQNEADYRSQYLGILGASKPTEQDKKLETVMSRVNSDPVIKQLSEQLKPGVGTVQPGTQEYNDLLTRIHKKSVPYYIDAGLPAPTMAELDTIMQSQPKQSFGDKVKNAFASTVSLIPGFGPQQTAAPVVPSAQPGLPAGIPGATPKGPLPPGFDPNNPAGQASGWSIKPIGQ